MKLYNYFRSSAAYRARIALNLKGVTWDHVGVHLLKKEQRSAEYLALNPAGLVPTLVDDEGHAFTQSLAIMEYLDETIASGAKLLPGDAIMRSHVRSLSLSLACDAHPLNNVRVLNYLSDVLKLPQEQKDSWISHWITTGLAAFEAVLAKHKAAQSPLGPGKFCVGDAPTMADCVLVPQVFSARRFNVDVSGFPLVAAIDANCAMLDAFAAARPAKQPDFQP